MVRPGPSDADIHAKVDAGFVDFVERDLCTHQLNSKMAKERIYLDSSDSGEKMWTADSLQLTWMRKRKIFFRTVVNTDL